MGLTRLGKLIFAGIIAVVVGITLLIIFLPLNKSEKQPEIIHDYQAGADAVQQPEDGKPTDVTETNITEKLIHANDLTEEKVAYLTFDDGPSTNTEVILDILDAYGIKATFFVLGENVEKNPDILMRIWNEGHTIGNHSYSHVYNVVYGTEEEFSGEIIKCEKAIGEVIGEENVTKLMRFPGGSKDDWKDIYRRNAENLGYKYVDWNALNGDADGLPFTIKRGMEEIKKYCTGKKNVVILLHDSPNKRMTADMLPQIIEYLVEQGYTFKKIEI